jgi:hypothetical protein
LRDPHRKAASFFAEIIAASDHAAAGSDPIPKSEKSVVGAGSCWTDTELVVEVDPAIPVVGDIVAGGVVNI